jgi:hypothetical protein
VIAGWIADVLSAIGQPAQAETEQRIRRGVAALAAKFPIYEARVKGLTPAQGEGARAPKPTQGDVPKPYPCAAPG